MDPNESIHDFSLGSQLKSVGSRIELFRVIISWAIKKLLKVPLLFFKVGGGMTYIYIIIRQTLHKRFRSFAFFVSFLPLTNFTHYVAS